MATSWAHSTLQKAISIYSNSVPFVFIYNILQY
jgi:hypothetical protein